MQHLTIENDNRSWLDTDDDSAGTDVLNNSLYRADMLSLVRHIMRERGDCDFIPIVRAFVVHPVNEWGHNAQIEVTYSRRGWRAIYGAYIGERVTKVQIYMD